MSYRLSSLGMGCALAALAAGGFSVCTVQAGGKDRGRSIEFSEPKSDEVTTNLHQLTSKKDSLKQLEEDLSKSLQPFSSKSSLDGVPEPPARPPAGPVIPNKRVKELLERRKNYIFMSPEDLMKGPTVEEMLQVPEYGPDGQEKQKLSPLEQYYQRLDTKRAADRKASQSIDDGLFGTHGKMNPRDDSGALDDPNMPAGLKESEQALKRFIGSDAADGGPAPPPKRNPYSDIFGLGDAASSPEETLKHKRLMQEFNSIYEPSRQPAFGAEGPNSLGGSSWAKPQSVQPLPGLDGFTGAKRRDGPETQPGTINPIFTPSGPADVNAQVLSQSSLTPATPKPEPPKAATPAPTFTAPRRPF